MRKEFLFREDEETLDQYLTKAARWFDQLRTGEIEDDFLEEVHQSKEKRLELTNYIYSVMEEKLIKYAYGVTSTWGLEESRKLFYQELLCEILESFHKYNNPKYNTKKYGTGFTNFLNVYCTRKAILSSVMFYKGYTAHLHRQMRQLQRALDKLVVELNLEEENIPFDYLHEIANESGCFNITENTLKLLLHEKFSSNNYNVSEYDAAYYEYGFDEIFRIDGEVREQLLEFYGTLRPIQQFIILQNYEACDDPWRKMSVKELGCDEVFLSIAKQDRFVKKKIERGNVVVKNQKDEASGKRIRSKERVFQDVEYVNEDYINGIRSDLIRRLCRFIELHEYGSSDLEGVIGDVSYEVWCALRKKFAF